MMRVRIGIGRRVTVAPTQAVTSAQELQSVVANGAARVDLEGTQRGWLRVQSSEQLLASLRASDALEALWRQ